MQQDGLGPAAGLKTRARRVLALVVFAAAAVLAVLNPSLAAFAVAGFALGWLLRNRRRLRALLALALDRPADPSDDVAARPRMLPVGGLVLAAASLVGTAVAAAVALFAVGGEGRPPSIRQVVPVSYSARATLETKREAFALRERLVVPADSLTLVREESAPENPAEFLARRWRAPGGPIPRLVGPALELSRERRSEAGHFGRLTRRATLALPIPDDLGGKADVVATKATVDVVTPKHWVLATAPPSDSERLPGDLEQRRLEEEDGLDERTMQVELAGPLFRNELGESLLGLSVSGTVKWGVLLVFGVLEDELAKLIGRILGKLRRRRGGSAPAPAPPPPPPTQS